MTTQLKLLRIGTVFTYKTRTYKKGSYVWSRSIAIKQGLQVLGEGDEILSAEPKLGGVFQETKVLNVWFGENTLVEVDRLNILNLLNIS